LRRQTASGAVKVEETSNAVGVKDVATREQMVELAKQRAELYKLENERKILKAKREIEMEKITHEAGANVARVDNWVADVKSGSSKSAGTGWASGKTGKSGKTKWSGSWRSRETVSTGVTMVTEEVHDAVLKRVAELEAEVKQKEAEVKKHADDLKEATNEANIKVRGATVARVMRYRHELGELRYEYDTWRNSNVIGSSLPDDFGQ
jgi:peptidoglycan hydrolase CwlO-like protein